MRCGCIECGAFMIHADDAEACVCPECGHRCSACLGTNTVVSREQLKNLAAVRWINQDIDRARDALAGKDTDEEDEPGAARFPSSLRW